ncbi:MAG: ABC transporter substrate-binding protein [Fusobacteriaceae bacterium]|nr:ABC transporter substrate-binding protein [Fusobacteriaceae bacterium]
MNKISKIKILGLLLIMFCSFAKALRIENNKIVDNYNNSIEMKEYKKIIVMDPAIVEIFYLLEAEESITAIANVTMSKIYPYDKTKDLPSVGTLTNPSIEKIVSFEPDLVIINPMATSLADNIKNLNIPVVVSMANNIEEIFQNIKVSGILTGRTKNADIISNKYKEKLDNLQNKYKNKSKIKGMLIFSTSPMMTFQKNTMPMEVFDILRIENIANDLQGQRPIISTEMVLEYDPDFIAGAMSISNVDSIKNANEVIKKTKAYKNNNIFIVDSTKILRGSPRIFEAMDEFAKEIENIERAK